MTKDDLLTLISSSFSQRADRADGGYLFCHTPDLGEFAYVGRVYDPVSVEFARPWFATTRSPENPYFAVVTEVANGLRIANISLYGVIDMIDRTGGGALGQPIMLDYGNLVERPPHLDDSDMVIGSIVGWSSTGDFVMRHDGSVRLVHPRDGSDVADEWPSLEAMLRAELGRIAALHDADGHELCTSTELMHPNGRRWETKIEPVSTLH